MGTSTLRAAVANSLLFAAIGIQAAVLVNQPPDQVSGTNMSSSIVADNFTLAATYNVTSFAFAAIQSSAADYSGSVYWAIHSNNAGVPGAVLFSAVAAAAAVPSGFSTGFGYDEYIFNVPVSFQLAAGDYWLALHNGPLANVGDAEMLWETSSSGNGPQGQYFDLQFNPNNEWLGTGNEHAFAVFGDRVVDPGVPVPSTLALLFGGLIAARSLRRARAAV